MKDYTKDIEFWKRLQSFVSDVQTNCCMGEEEKQMIIHNCKLKILDIQRVSNSVCRYYGTNDCKDFEPYKGILYGLCNCKNDYCAYKDKPNKDDIVESEL